MKKVIAMIIEDGKDARMEVNAGSKERASIFIEAPNMQTALIQLEMAEAQAEEACKNYVPEEKEPKEEKPQKHYKVSRIATEDIQEYFKDCETDKDKQRIKKGIENARIFTHRKDGGGLRMSEIDYFYMLIHKDIWEGLTAMYDYAFRRGYNKGTKSKKA